MPTDPRALLVLTQWLSPAYPLGSFAYSHGLEAAVADGMVTPQTLDDWLTDLLAHGSGRTDTILLHAAARGENPDTLAHWARAITPAAERAREAERQGAAFARHTAAIWGIDLPPLPLPVAIGRACWLLDLDADLAAALYLQGFLANLVAAAQRLMPLGQTDAHAILARLAPLIAETAEDTEGRDTDDLTGCAFLSDIAALRHETLTPRIFQS